MGERVRTLHVINSLGAGGAERSLAEMVALLPRYGVDPEVVVLEDRTVGVAEQVSRHTPVHRVVDLGRARTIRELRRLLRRRRPDVVHTTLFESDVLGRIAAAGTGIPLVTSLVNMAYDDSRLDDPRVRRSRLVAARSVDAATARHLTHGFHALSRAVRDNAIDVLGIDPALVEVIPRGRSRARLGVPSPERRTAARRSLGLRDDQVMLLNIGRQEFQKGQDLLLRACAELRGDRPYHLVIAGREGNATADLQSLVAELGIESDVSFLGARDDIGDLLCAADLFVFPSRFEGFGGSLIEALAMGVPILATDIGPCRELLADDELGALVPVDDLPAWVAAIRRSGADTTAAERAARGQVVFDERYRIEPVTERFAEWLRGSAR